MSFEINNIHTSPPRCKDEIHITNFGIVKCSHQLGHKSNHGDMGYEWADFPPFEEEVPEVPDSDVVDYVGHDGGDSHLEVTFGVGDLFIRLSTQDQFIYHRISIADWMDLVVDVDNKFIGSLNG